MKVEIWSDVVCPWCYVGKRCFDEAVKRFDGDVDVEFRAFELDPSVPAAGMPLDEYLQRKFGSRATVEATHERLAQLGSDVGIEFRWGGKRRVNTFDAHRLLAWALDTAGAETQARLKERLMRGYFTDNLDAGDHEVLAELAGEVDFDPGLAADVLASERYGDRVRADEARARGADIYAVPTFVIDNRFAIPGAQDTDTFAALLNRAAELSRS